MIVAICVSEYRMADHNLIYFVLLKDRIAIKIAFYLIKIKEGPTQKVYLKISITILPVLLKDK